MYLNDVCMVASDTTRTRAYIYALIRHQLLPRYVILLNNEAKDLLPGQSNQKSSLDDQQLCEAGEDDFWSEATFDQSASLTSLLKSVEIDYDIASSSDINHKSVIRLVQRRPESVFIFSGFGGVLLKKEILSIGKKFLHVHGGYLPEYKGSTANYYSMLDSRRMGASAIFLTNEIDGGPILLRRMFPIPKATEDIDHIFDSAARAKVLIEVLKSYVDSGEWCLDLESDQDGDTYYVIHPVLKHIAILSKHK